MREYGKVFSRIWESADFRALSEDGQKLVLYLLTCQHGTLVGLFRLPDGYAAEDLQWPAERVSKGFDELLKNGFANRCTTTKWVLISKFLEWNPLENPNQRKAAAKIALSVPDSCAWKQAFMRVSGHLLGLEAGPEDNGSGTLSEGFANQEQEQEQKISEEAKASSSSAKPTKRPKVPTIPCPYDAIVDAYHEHLPSLPRVKLRDGPTWTDRQKAMRSLWGWVLSSRKSDGTPRASTGEQALDWIAGYFGRAAENDFVMGRTHKSAGHEGWRADFDFLLSKKGMKQVIEKTQEAA